MKIAVAKYPVHAPASFADFAQRITTVLGQASEQGARIAVLPEYLSLELAASLGEPVAADLKASLAGIQAFRQAWLALFAGLARQLREIRERRVPSRLASAEVDTLALRLLGLFQRRQQGVEIDRAGLVAGER